MMIMMHDGGDDKDDVDGDDDDYGRYDADYAR